MHAYKKTIYKIVYAFLILTFALSICILCRIPGIYEDKCSILTHVAKITNVIVGLANFILRVVIYSNYASGETQAQQEHRQHPGIIIFPVFYFVFSLFFIQFLVVGRSLPVDLQFLNILQINQIFSLLSMYLALGA